MATDYSLSLKATLDTSEVEQKLSKVGNQGSASFQGIEQAVKRLEQAINKLDQSMQKNASNVARKVNAASPAATASPQMKQLLRMGAATLGGQVLGTVADQAAMQGNTSLAVGARAGQGALQGAAMGAMFGPAGIAIGATAGALNSAFAELASSAKKASSALMASALKQQQEIKTWHQAEKQTAFNKEMRGLEGETSEQLEARVRAFERARGIYEEFTTPQSKSQQKFEQEYTGSLDDWAATREKRRQELQAEMDRLAKFASSAEQILKSRAKATPSTPLSMLLSTTSSLAATGRDVGGYGRFKSVDQQQLAAQENQVAKTEQVIEQTKAVHDVALNLYSLLMRRFMETSSTGAKWQ